MDLLEIVPEGLLSPDYGVLERGEVIGVIENKTLSLKDKGAILVRGGRFTVHREGVLSGDFLMTAAGGEVVARAVKQSIFRDTLDIIFGERRFVLMSRVFSLRNRFDLAENGRTIGGICQRGIFSRSMVFESAAGIPLEIRMFIVWLALLIRRRNAAFDSSAGSGGDGSM